MSEYDDFDEEPVNDEELEIERGGNHIEGYAEDDLGMDNDE